VVAAVMVLVYGVAVDSHEDILRPFGPGILDGYETCGAFKDDTVHIFMEIEEGIIEENKNIHCTTIYYYNNKPSYNGIPNSHNRGEEEVPSYQTNNQVPNVEEQDCV